MHIRVNADYQLPDCIIVNIINMAALLVELFFIISGFGMCCGYYESVKNGQISMDRFFKKRYLKILPFFAILVCIDLLLSFNQSSLIESFSDLTLMYGFFPNSNIKVIGVGWALGVIFAFYMLFPFFVFMIWNKRRAWFFLAVTIMIDYFCKHYFLVDGKSVNCNIASWLCYFVVGGLIYLYREQIENIVSRFRIVSLILVALISIGWYISPSHIGNIDISTIKLIILFSSWLSYAISVKSVILSNPFTKYMSGISFEIYLSHMVIFRVVEKLHLLHLFNNDVLSYIVASAIVLIVVSAFATIMKMLINKAIKLAENYMHKKSA